MQFVRHHFRWLVACLLILWQGHTHAFVEANAAPANDLSSIRGIGPATAQRIIEARESKAFLHWKDFIERVRGIGPKRAQQLSDGGLRVRGKAYGDQQKWHTIAPRRVPANRKQTLTNPFAPTGIVRDDAAR